MSARTFAPVSARQHVAQTGRRVRTARRTPAHRATSPLSNVTVALAGAAGTVATGVIGGTMFALASLVG